MPKITFINHDESVQEVEVASGTSVMQAALDNGVEAIIAECGGACSCATCHVYVADDWVSKVPAADDVESDMIDCVLEPKDNSRLSCQIIVDDSLDGLVVNVPEKQY